MKPLISNYEGILIKYADPEIRAEKIGLAAVQQDGWALEYLSDELRADKEVVLAAVRKTAPLYNMPLNRCAMIVKSY